MQQISMWESSLASCAIEDNQFAQIHLNVCRDMELLDKYNYLKKLFDELEGRKNEQTIL
mgnify:CR=1 FL=1